MKNIILTIGLALILVTAFAQNTNLQVTGGYLNVSNATYIKLENANLTNNGNLTATNGTITMTGNQDATIGGNGTTQLYQLTIDKSNSKKTTLGKSILVNNNLNMNNGLLDLAIYTLTLGTANGTIVGEDANSYITASSTGIIQKTVTLGIPNYDNPGNLGIAIKTDNAPGVTTIKRGHAANAIGNNMSATRYYIVEPTYQSLGTINVKFNYFDHESNGISESDFEVFQGENNAWVHVGATTTDPTLNYITTTSMDKLSKYTIGKGLLKIKAKVLLSGAYDTGGLMKDELRTNNLLPTTEPYAALGYTHINGGNEAIFQDVFNQTGNDAIVDWVFLELRDASNPNTVVATRSALLQKDGDIVDIDGAASVTFDATAGNYHLVIKHRNHIGVMSDNSIALSKNVIVFDFSNNLANIEGGTNGAKDLTSGYYGLYSGDFNRDGQIQNSDINSMLSTIGTSGYLSGDLDMNGQVQNSDVQNKLRPHLGKGAQFQY